MLEDVLKDTIFDDDHVETSLINDEGSKFYTFMEDANHTQVVNFPS